MRICWLNMSVRLSANERALMLMSTMSSLNLSISISIIRRKLMLMHMSRLSSLAHNLLMLMFILMLASQVKTGLNSKTLFKPEEFENAGFSLRLGLPSKLIHHENETFRKRSSNQRKLRTLTFLGRFRVDRKRIFF